MDTAIAPIAATTSLSILLHGAAVAVLLAVYSQTSPSQVMGQGVEIELISSVTAAGQHETDIPRKQLSVPQQQVMPEKVNDVLPVKEYRKNQSVNIQVVTALNDSNSVAITESADKKIIEQVFEKHEPEMEQPLQSIFENNSNASVVQSTDASQQRHLILELLHNSISNNKKYPYLARRQRREGTTTVAFVLHPDGTIENTRLINSSQAVTLDRAALSAVENIEPFKAAQEYLERAEEFQVDVVFNLF